MAKKIRPFELEIKLAKLHQNYAALRGQVHGLGYVLAGTVQKRQYRCGKPNCRCVTQGLLHGPYHQWTRKVRGKTVNINLDPTVAQQVQEWIQNNRKLRQLCYQMEQTSLAVLQTRTRLGKI
jgi:hypothetical protein